MNDQGYCKNCGKYRYAPNTTFTGESCLCCPTCHPLEPNCDTELPPFRKWDVSAWKNYGVKMGYWSFFKQDVLSELRKRLPRERKKFWVGLNPDTEEQEIITNPDGLWGEDMSFAYNAYRQEVLDILDELS